MSNMYDISARLGGYSAVEAGSSLLLASQDETKTRKRVLDILGDGLTDGDGAIIVTTETPVSDLLTTLEDQTTFASHAVAIIDCTGSESREHTELENGVFVYRVPSPADLTGIGIGLTESFNRLESVGIDRCRVSLLSLSAMLADADEAEIFKFCHVVSSRLDSAGFLGLFTINPQRVERHAYRIVSEAFKETVELDHPTP